MSTEQLGGNKNNFLNPVRALLRRIHRLVAIIISTVVDRALIVIVSGYQFDEQFDI
jgi:hypothetical protein